MLSFTVTPHRVSRHVVLCGLSPCANHLYKQAWARSHRDKIRSRCVHQQNDISYDVVDLDVDHAAWS